jgi:hypothetical protein
VTRLVKGPHHRFHQSWAVRRRFHVLDEPPLGEPECRECAPQIGETIE